MSATIPLASAQIVRFHLSLNVSDISRSLSFYQTLFGMGPAKVRADYAKFELNDPPLVLSLEPRVPGKDGVLNHMGFRMPDAGSLVAMQRRLEQSGIHTRREEGVECCYARQTKFWVHDPDGTLWEVYTFDGDLEHRGAGQVPEKVLPPAPQPSTTEASTSWEHRMNQEIPSQIEFGNDSLEEIRLRGTLNLPVSEEHRTRLFSEATRALKPGGRLFVHVLTATQPFSGDPNLPGPAGAVQFVPVESDVVGQLRAAGFQGIRMLKFDAKPCFVREGIPMRETQIEAWKPGVNTESLVSVLYKGPFAEIRDDEGNVFRRGEWVKVSREKVARLGTPEWATQFLIVD